MFNSYQQATTSVQQSFVQHLNSMERAKKEEYILYREYYDGVHRSQLTDRLRQFLGLKSDSEFTANYCPIVVDTKVERLKVTNIDADEQDELLWSWWRKNRMDAKQGVVHHAAVVDGDAFVLVEWDSMRNMPVFHFERAYAGDGVMVYYSEENRDQIEFASKHWRITRGNGAGATRRMNLYFPDRIEKYVSRDEMAYGAWRPVDPAMEIYEGHLGPCNVIWWTDTGDEFGEPLGVPIVHFKHNDTGDSYGTSHLARVIPIQDAVNKTLIDVIAANDSNGFGLYVGYGTDAWSSIKVGPGAIAAVTKPPSEAKLERLAGESSNALLASYQAFVMEIARVTGTPLSHFQMSGQVAAEGTMKQQEATLIKQVEKAQTDFGNSWEDCLNMGRKLFNVFGAGTLDLDVDVEVVWEPAESRNEREQVETLAIKVNELGVSPRQAQIEMGYRADQIAVFSRERLRQIALQIRGSAANETGRTTGNQAGDRGVEEATSPDTELQAG